MLCAGGYGNTPIAHLLPRRTTTILKFYFEYASASDWAALPPVDVVFNAAGDADLVPDPAALRSSLAGLKVFNHPDRVALTRRDRLGELLAGIDGVVVPRVLRLAPSEPLAGRLAGEVLVRPLGSHGGGGVHLLTDPPPREEPVYVTQFHDFRSADGNWRKYRMIFVAGRAWPCHLAISSSWLVHWFSADMARSAAKCAEEQAFLENPGQILGGRAYNAVEEIGRRLGLDFAGIDFALLQDGRVLVFEANATMLVHADDDPDIFAYRQAPVARILAAFHDSLRQRQAARV